MLGDDHVEHLGILQGPQHDGRVLHAVAVVGEPAGPRFGHHPHLGQLDPLAFLRDRAHDVDMGLTGLAALAVHVLDVGLALDGGIRVRHADDRREAGRHGRRGTAGDRLLFFVARVAEMDVNIDQAGRDQLARGVDDPRNGLLNGSIEVADLGHLAVGDQNVARLVQSIGRIDHPPVLDQKLIRHSAPVPLQRPQ